MLGWVERKESHGSWAALIPDGIKIVRCRRLQFFYVELGYVRIGFFFSNRLCDYRGRVDNVVTGVEIIDTNGQMTG